MKQPMLPLGVPAMLVVAISVAAGAGILASGQGLELALAFAALLLAASHLLVFFYRDLGYRRNFACMSEMQQRSRKLAEQLSNLMGRVHVLEDERAEPPPQPKPAPADFSREFEELRRSVEALAGEYGRASAPRAEAQPRPSALPDERPGVVQHQLEFFLEPIVSFAEDATAHYRASLVLEGNGQRVTFEELTRQAAANGLRPDLDGHAVSRALAVGSRLAAKRPGTAIFVPIGPDTLAAQGALAAIEGQISRSVHGAANLVFEIDHRAMAALGQRGIEGMARLARNGAGLALARAHGTGLDLDALRDLHFRFLTFGAAALPADRSALSAWAETARLARNHGFIVGVQDLINEEQIPVASRWASLGSGPAFAPPRRVKGEAIPVNQVRSAA
jgi:EAL domain-containing protein (putative c-di-GMP-specific phosphodiesterase class I)